MVDEPDFNGVHHGFIFVVSNANDDGCVFIGGEISGVVIRGAIWSQEVEFCEAFADARCSNKVDKDTDRKDNGKNEDDGENFVNLCFRVREAEVQRKGKAILRWCFLPSTPSEDS